MLFSDTSRIVVFMFDFTFVYSKRKYPSHLPIIKRSFILLTYQNKYKDCYLIIRIPQLEIKTKYT